ncbi:MAG: SPOR domain-containing protein [Candidatus Accumulibacter sp.]|jgi:hypothetical protein|nr:SPOR domain-containing protein [Accumulibacter sp.]
MSRDTKPRRSAGPRRAAGGTLFGLCIGLIGGVLIAAAVVWYIHRTPPPFAAKTPPAAPPTAAAPGGAAPGPLALPGKPGDPIPKTAADKPRFDFYKILPGETPGDPRQSAKAGEPAKEPQDPRTAPLKEAIFLQTGSFQNAGDADNQKARLAMAGIEAAVEQVMLQDKTWYRVRLGPFRKIEEVNTLRGNLAREGIEATIVK